MTAVQTVNTANPSVDLTVRIYDQFYAYDVNVPAAEYDIVLSFFKNATNNSQIAESLTSSLFQVSSATNIPVFNLLETMQGQSGLELTASMAYYLNNIRSRATLLGVNAQTVPNFYAARAVLQ